MQKKEAEFCTEFQKWFAYNHWGTSFCWEAKIVYSYDKHLIYSGAFPKDRVTLGLHHELVNLRNAKHGMFIYKISDLDRLQKPFDGFAFVGAGEAYVVVKWEDSKDFYIIDVDKIIAEIESGSKSLTKERAVILADRIGEVKSSASGYNIQQRTAKSRQLKKAANY